MTSHTVHSSSFSLPVGLKVAKFSAGINWPAYEIVVNDPPTDFENWHISTGKPPDVAQLAMAFLIGGGTLVDAGANIGFVSIPAARAGSRVISVEPDIKNCLKITLGAAINNCKNLELCQAALTDIDGIVAFSGEEAWGHISNTEQVRPVMALKFDTLMMRNFSKQEKGPASPLVIKIDVEGHESLVLRGASATLKALRPVIIFESIEIEGQVIRDELRPKSILEKYNYSLYLIRDEVLVPSSSKALQEGHVSDFLAVPDERSNLLDSIDWQVRTLTGEESIAWIQEMADFPMVNHHRHAVGVLKRWALERRMNMALVRPVIETLLSKNDVADSHRDLKELLS